MTTTAMPGDPPWLQRAFSDLGLQERPGAASHPRIIDMYRKAGHPRAASLDDSVWSWCSAAMCAWCVEGGVPGTNSLVARSWLGWGRPLNHQGRIPRGAVVIFRRGNSEWQGHVCICLEDRGDRLVVIGGNQNDAVTIAMYPRAPLLGARWAETATNSPEMQFLTGGGGGMVGAEGVGAGAGQLAANSDQVAQAIGVAQAQVMQISMYVRWAQYLLMALAIGAFVYGMWRMVQRHFKPRELPPVDVDGPSIDDVAMQPPLWAAQNRPRRKRRATKRRKDAA